MLVWVLIIGLTLLTFVLLSHNSEQGRAIDTSEFIANVKAGNVESVKLNRVDGTVRGEFRSIQGQPAGATKTFNSSYNPDDDRELIKLLDEHQVKFDYVADDNMLLRVVLGLLPYVLLGLLLVYLVMRLMRGMAGGGGMLGNFGRSRHRVTTREHTNITFADVAGVEEAKEEVSEIIEFLKNPKKFQRLGGRIPRGVLLVGPPGTGKTLLAKAIAGEADVPFFSISGSDFVEMFVGVGASRVRDLFKQAKENSPCIIFLDEIDAVGRRRGGAGWSGGGHDEREQTLNAILVEMDGFDTSDQVIVIAATNRSDILDPALTRPGRFDRQIQVPLPDIKGRLEILKVHARKVKLSPHTDLSRLARGTPMFSGADLAAIINEAAISATMAEKDAIEQGDLEEARDKVHWGRARKSHVIDEQEKVVTAYHEAGHTMAACLLDEVEPLHKVSIIPRGPALGATFQLPEKDRHLYTRRKVLSEIQLLFAGRIAEAMFCGDISSGASNDIQRATEMARTMVCDWGMSQALGPIRYARGDADGHWDPTLPSQEYSDKTAQTIDAEIQSIVSTCYAQTEKLLGDHRQQLDAIAKALLKYETLTADEVDKLIKGETLDRPTVGDLLAAERKRTVVPAEIVELGPSETAPEPSR